MRPSGKIVIVNPMESQQPTGMGVAGAGLSQCLSSYAETVAGRIFRFINDCLPWQPLRIVTRQLICEILAFWYKNCKLIFATHHGSILIKGGHTVVVHDVICIKYPFQNRMQAFSYLLFLPRILQSADQIVAISECVKSSLLEHFPRISGAKIRVIPSVSNKNRPEKIHDHSKSPTERLRQLLFVGAKYRHKRLEDAIEIFKILNQQGFHIDLVVVGITTAIWEEEIKTLADSSFSGRLKVRQFVSDAELEQLYSESAVLLFLSAAEGLGFPPLEAMRKGCPVICNDIPELRETCHEAVWYIKRGDYQNACKIIKRLLGGEMQEELDRKKIAAVERLAFYSYDRVCSLWLQLCLD